MQNDLDESAEFFLEAIELEPNNADLLANLGYTYMQQRKWDIAIQTLEKTLTINPSHQRTLINLKNAKAALKSSAR